MPTDKDTAEGIRRRLDRQCVNVLEAEAGARRALEGFTGEHDVLLGLLAAQIELTNTRIAKLEDAVQELAHWVAANRERAEPIPFPSH